MNFAKAQTSEREENLREVRPCGFQDAGQSNCETEAITWNNKRH